MCIRDRHRTAAVCRGLSELSSVGCSSNTLAAGYPCYPQNESGHESSGLFVVSAVAALCHYLVEYAGHKVVCKRVQLVVIDVSYTHLDNA